MTESPQRPGPAVPNPQPHQAAQYPAGQYPAGQYPAGQYPAGQYPAGQNPGRTAAPPTAQQGYQQPAPGYPYPYPYAAGNGAAPQESEKGFFGSLFDFSFNNFVTPKIVKVVYVLVVLFTTLALLFSTIAMFSVNGGLGVAELIFGTIFAILYLAVFRMVLEFFLGVHRMSQDVHGIGARQGI
jgi:Domain of unknown function (DUF4282)